MAGWYIWIILIMKKNLLYLSYQLCTKRDKTTMVYIVNNTYDFILFYRE